MKTDILAETKRVGEQLGKILVHGKDPVHIHSCGCECNSPYCGDLLPCNCENHGGPNHIAKGREPWRGR